MDRQVYGRVETGWLPTREPSGLGKIPLFARGIHPVVITKWGFFSRKDNRGGRKNHPLMCCRGNTPGTRFIRTKPIVGIRPLVEAYSDPGAIVLDPSAGSGTTGAAARNCGRRFILLEKAERMSSVAGDRLATQNGLAGQWNAVRASSE